MTSQFPNLVINSQFSIIDPSAAFGTADCSLLVSVLFSLTSVTLQLPGFPPVLLPLSSVSFTCYLSYKHWNAPSSVTILHYLDWSHSVLWLPIPSMSWFPSVHLSLSLSLELETHMSDCFLITPLWGQTGLRSIANSYVENGTPESCSPYLLHLTSILVHSNTIPSAAQSQNPGVSLNPSLSHTPHPICQKTLSAFKICVKADGSSVSTVTPSA